MHPKSNKNPSDISFSIINRFCETYKVNQGLGYKKRAVEAAALRG